MTTPPASFTAGPWTVIDNDSVHAQRPGQPYTVVVADCYGYLTEREANARLIASAPALYAALDSLVESIEADCVHPDQVEQARAALALASRERAT